MKILNDFLDRWSLYSVKRMTLKEYVGVGNPDTFCQWLETRTKRLGSIKGMYSIKFEIYERVNKKKIPKDISYGYDNKYNWRDRHGNNRNQAFNKIKEIIVKIIESAQKGDFKAIDSLPFTPMVKWKIAFLYSGEKLIPIYNKKVLRKIAQYYKMKNYRKARVSALHKYILNYKPKDKNIYQFGHELFYKFSSAGKINEMNKHKNGKRRIKKGVTKKKKGLQVRKGTKSYVADTKHNEMQEKFRELLLKNYSSKNIIMEENNVDIKLIEKDCITFFEIKAKTSAEECLKEALGQVLSYICFDKNKVMKKIVVVGPNLPNKEEKQLIAFIRNNLKIDFTYRAFSI